MERRDISRGQLNYSNRVARWKPNCWAVRTTTRFLSELAVVKLKQLTDHQLGELIAR